MKVLTTLEGLYSKNKLIFGLSILLVIVTCVYVAYRAIYVETPAEVNTTNQVLEKLDERIKSVEEKIIKIDTNLNQKVVIIRETVQTQVNSLAPDDVAVALTDELNEFRSNQIRSPDLDSSN